MIYVILDVVLLSLSPDHTNNAAKSLPLPLPLQESVQLDAARTEAWLHLGIAQLSLGELDACVAAFHKAVELQPGCREAWVNMGHALKEAARVEEAQAAFSKALGLDRSPSASLGVWRLMLQMRQNCGNHEGAVKLATMALAHAPPAIRPELLYWRGMADCTRSLLSVLCIA